VPRPTHETDAGATIAAPTANVPAQPSAGESPPARVANARHASRASGTAHTNPSSHTAAQANPANANSGSSGGTRTRIVNGVPIVQDDF
jgi:hypothetical protein